MQSDIQSSALKISLSILLAAFIGVVSACAVTPTTSNAPTDAVPTVPAEAVSTPAPATPTPTPVPTPTPEDTTLTLTFWTVEPLSPEADGQAGQFFDSTLRAFQRAHPDIQVDVVLKKASGKGGVLDFLRTARPVAPAVLPDVAVMNATDLPQAFAEGLVQPLDGKLDRSVVQDLLPAARRMGQVDTRLAGVPLGLDMEHAVYNTLVFTGTPILWTDVLSRNTRYLFPAKGVNGLVNDATLSHYFSAGGTFLDDQGEPQVDEQTLQQVLTLYQQGVAAGTLDTRLLEAASTEELWPFYLEGKAGLTLISVRQFLTDRELLKSSAYAPPPVIQPDDQPVAITHGWVLVLVTSDPARQKAALNLMEWLLSTRNNATWNQINRSIPSRDSAYQQLADEDPYWDFLLELLKTAQPYPAFPGYDQFGRVLQQAVQQVISGEATAEEATITAVDALTQ